MDIWWYVSSIFSTKSAEPVPSQLTAIHGQITMDAVVEQLLSAMRDAEKLKEQVRCDTWNEKCFGKSIPVLNGWIFWSDFQSLPKLKPVELSWTIQFFWFQCFFFFAFLHRLFGEMNPTTFLNWWSQNVVVWPWFFLNPKMPQTYRLDVAPSQ